MDKHVNLLYVQNDDNVGHFVWIKDLSRLVSPIEQKGAQKIFLQSVSMQQIKSKVFVLKIKK